MSLYKKLKNYFYKEESDTEDDKANSYYGEKRKKDNGEIYIPEELSSEQEAKSLKVRTISLLLIGVVTFVAVAIIVNLLPGKDKKTNTAANNAANKTVSSKAMSNMHDNLPSKYSELSKYNALVQPNKPANQQGADQTQNPNLKNTGTNNAYKQITPPSRVMYVNANQDAVPQRGTENFVNVAAQAADKQATLQQTKAAPIFFNIKEMKSDEYGPQFATGALGKAQYVLQIGSVIPAMLLTGITSDLGPSDVVAQVQDNVYDSLTGNYLLIPKGSKIVGKSGKAGNRGNPRISVAFKKIIFPDGVVLNLPEPQAVDGAGYQGLRDKYDTHDSTSYRSAFLGAILAAAAQSATGNSYGRDERTAGQEAVAGSVASILQTARDMARRDLYTTPTVIISPGYQFNVFINRELSLGEYDGD